MELNALQPLAHLNFGGLNGNYAVLLVKPNVNGGADIVGPLSDVDDSLVNAFILRMAKEQVAKDEADKELGAQIANKKNDLFAANDEQQRKFGCSPSDWAKKEVSDRQDSINLLR